MFTTKKWYTYSDKKIWRKEKTEIMNISSHVLRHIFATGYYGVGMLLIVVQNYLAHSNINITASIYASTNVEDVFLIKAIEKMSNFG